MNNLMWTHSYLLNLKGVWSQSKNNSIFLKKLRSQGTCFLGLFPPNTQNCPLLTPFPDCVLTKLHVYFCVCDFCCFSLVVFVLLGFVLGFEFWFLAVILIGFREREKEHEFELVGRTLEGLGEGKEYDQNMLYKNFKITIKKQKTACSFM